MSTIKIFSGWFDLSSPKASDVRIEDIAHSLSKLCRFTGHVHTDGIYSVAEHSVLCSWLVPRAHAWDALLHDASEAYTGDVRRPMKLILGDAFRAVEWPVRVAVAERFGLTIPTPAEVTRVDNSLLATESAELAGFECDYPPAQVRVACWDPATAKRMFLHRFHELNIQRQHARHLAGAAQESTR